MKQLSIITLFFIQVTIYSSSFAIEHVSLPLWPGSVPGETEPKAPSTIDENRSGNITRINKVTDPTITVYEPLPEKRNGAAVVICPGGGYHILAIDLEGYEIAEWLSSLGYTAFILQYRVPQKAGGALQDAARAIRLVRASHEKWGIDKEKIGVLGFSAGGSLSARISCRFDEDLYEAVDSSDAESARPDFAVLIYPAYLDHGPNKSLTPELVLNKDIPPMFLYVAADDRHASSSLVMGAALREKGIPVELHMLPNGGHGFGLRKGKRVAETWPQYCETWLDETVLKRENVNILLEEGRRQVAPLPPMGWNSWNTFKKDINEQLFIDTADALIDSGLAEAGYVYVNIDDGWSPDDNASVALADKFPNGIGYLADYMHDRGLKLGLYSNWRSHGHEERDARQWAEWEIDFIKNDAWKTLSTDACWNRMRNALAASGRTMVHSVHFSDEESNPSTICETANMWRITNDIKDYYSHESIPEGMTDWAFATLDIIDRMAEVTQLIKPGCWADPDMLEIGNGNQTVDEYKTQFTMWCLLPAPLILGNDVRNMSEETKEILLNKEAIAINQDPAVIPAQRIRKTDEMDLWSRKLADGSLCVVLLNKTESARKLEFSWEELGLKMGQHAEVRDLWEHETIGTFTNNSSIKVNAHGCAMLKLTHI